MKSSEKLLLGILLVGGVGYVGYEYLLPQKASAQPANHQITQVPPPETVSVDQMMAQTTDETPPLTREMVVLRELEHSLLTTGYEAKIAENKKAQRVAAADAEKAEAEVESLRMGNAMMVAPDSPPPPQTNATHTEPRRAAPRSSDQQVSVNTFLPNGSAIVTIGDKTATVNEGMTISGVRIVKIDPAGRRLSVEQPSGRKHQVPFSTAVTRVVADVERLKKSEQGN